MRDAARRAGPRRLRLVTTLLVLALALVGISASPTTVPPTAAGPAHADHTAVERFLAADGCHGAAYAPAAARVDRVRHAAPRPARDADEVPVGQVRLVGSDPATGPRARAPDAVATWRAHPLDLLPVART